MDSDGSPQKSVQYTYMEFQLPYPLYRLEQTQGGKKQ